MTTSLYRVNSGDLPLASDLDQLVDVFNGNNDVGQITFAPQTTAPTFTATAATAAGTALGIGAYIYRFTWVVGYKKSNNTFVFGGETTSGPSVTVTTTSGNQAVSLSGLPTAFPSVKVVGLRIYRTAVGGADNTQKLVTTLTTLSATYTDTTADGSLGATMPTVNTTGTTIPGSAVSGALVSATIPFSGITSKPTTISGYGITDNIVASITAGANISVTNPSSGLGAATVGLTGIVPVANGGTGSSTQNFVDLTTAQMIGGTKTFSTGVYINGTVLSFGGGTADVNIIPAAGKNIGFTNSAATQWLLRIAENSKAVLTYNNTLDDGSGNATIAGGLSVNSTINSIAGANGGTMYWTMAMRGSLKILTIYLNAFNTNGTQQSFNLPTGFQYGAILSSSLGDTSVNFEYSTNGGSTWTGSNLPSVPQNIAINAALNAFGINIAAASGAKTGTLIIEGI